jgi:uncharacterized membrane protein
VARGERQDAGRGGESGGPSGLADLREELGAYVDGLVQRLTDKAGDTVAGLTDRLTDMAEGEGGLLGAGSRILQGQSPISALVGQKASDVKDKVVGAAKDVFGGGGGGKAGGVKAVNIVESLDVGVPRRTAYDQWTRFEDFSGFTKGVRGVSRDDDGVTSDWNLKVGPSSRSWKATVKEQVPDERIEWTSEGAKGTTHGAVTFHELGPALTRILVVVEYRPAGFFEKTGNLWRAQGRRLRLDLKHFGRHITLGADEDVEGWRGEVRDGEVVRSHEEGLEDDEDTGEEYPDDEGGFEGGQDDGNADEDAEGDDEDFPDEEEEEEEDDEDDEDAGEDERPRPRRRSRR